MTILLTAIIAATIGITATLLTTRHRQNTRPTMSPSPTPLLHEARTRETITDLRRQNRALARENQRLHEELTQAKKDRIKITEVLREARKSVLEDSLANVIAAQTGTSAAEVRRVMAGGGVTTPEGEHLIDPLTPAVKYRGKSIRYVRRIIEIEDDA